MSFPNKIRGTNDILPDTHKYHNFLKKVFRHELRKNGFRRITTPIFESEELFLQSIGENTDIIKNQLYSFEDKKGKRLALKPDSTVSVLRSYLENNMIEDNQPVFLYYLEPHFRQEEKPGKSRYRQFFQVGGEIIGESDPILDAQLIYIGYKILNKIGLEGDFKIKINSLGIQKERAKYIEELNSFYENKKHLLSQESLELLEKNPIRILESKIEDEKILAGEAPKIIKFLKKDSREHYTKVKEYLELLGVPYEEDNTLIRGFDYYNHTVWEFEDISGRTTESFGGGGRYDGLSKLIGHQEDIPGVGFAFGMERLVEAMVEKGITLKNKDKIDLYFIQLGEEAKKAVLPLTLEAREKGINTMVSLGTPSLKIQMKKATKINSRYVVMVGIMEAKNGIYQVRDMLEGTQEEVKRENLIEYIIGKIGNEKLDFYCPANDLIIK